MEFFRINIAMFTFIFATFLLQSFSCSYAGDIEIIDTNLIDKHSISDHEITFEEDLVRQIKENRIQMGHYTDNDYRETVILWALENDKTEIENEFLKKFEEKKLNSADICFFSKELYSSKEKKHGKGANKLPQFVINALRRSLRDENMKLDVCDLVLQHIFELNITVAMLLEYINKELFTSLQNVQLFNFEDGGKNNILHRALRSRNWTKGFVTYVTKKVNAKLWLQKNNDDQTPLDVFLSIPENDVNKIVPYLETLSDEIKEQLQKETYPQAIKNVLVTNYEKELVENVQNKNLKIISFIINKDNKKENLLIWALRNNRFTIVSELLKNFEQSSLTIDHIHFFNEAISQLKIVNAPEIQGFLQKLEQEKNRLVENQKVLLNNVEQKSDQNLNQNNDQRNLEEELIVPPQKKKPKTKTDETKIINTKSSSLTEKILSYGSIIAVSVFVLWLVRRQLFYAMTDSIRSRLFGSKE